MQSQGPKSTNGNPFVRSALKQEQQQEQQQQQRQQQQQTGDSPCYGFKW